MKILNTMASYAMVYDIHGKRVYTNVKLVLPNPPRFVGWGGLEQGLILYTSHLLASFNLGRRQPVKFNANGRKSSLDVGLAGSVGNSIFHL